MTTSESKECREAFEKWINTSKGYGLAFARECWNTAWQSRPIGIDAEELVRRLESIKIPPDGCTDWNDALKKAIAIVHEMVYEMQSLGDASTHKDEGSTAPAVVSVSASTTPSPEREAIAKIITNAAPNSGHWLEWLPEVDKIIAIIRALPPVDDAVTTANKALLLAARWFKINYEDETLIEHPPSKS